MATGTGDKKTATPRGHAGARPSASILYASCPLMWQDAQATRPIILAELVGRSLRVPADRESAIRSPRWPNRRGPDEVPVPQWAAATRLRSGLTRTVEAMWSWLAT